MKRNRSLLALIAAVLLTTGVVEFANRVSAQSVPTTTIPPMRIYTAYASTPISATAAAGAAAVLTIPAPPTSFFNYVCYLAIEGSNNGTVLAVTNAVTTSTNFNGFAAKFSTPGAASTDTGVLALITGASPGCAKSAAAATATTFTSPTSTDEAYAWYAIYFQAP